jgi:hypothetical protein
VRCTRRPILSQSEPLNDAGGVRRSDNQEPAIPSRAGAPYREACRRKIEMSPGAQSRADTPGGGGPDSTIIPPTMASGPIGAHLSSAVARRLNHGRFVEANDIRNF